jgi:hypothetical protein
MERIGKDVRRELDRFAPASGLADLVTAWPDAVGVEVARNAWPARIARDGTLHVATSSSAWAFELAQLAEDVLGQLRERMGGAAPVALKFAAGKIPDAPETTFAEAVEPPREPTPEERARAAELASSIANEELRETVAAAVARGLATGSGDRSF